MRALEKQDEAWEKQLTSCQLFFLGLILPFPSSLPVFPEPLPVFHRALSYEKVFPSFVYLLRKKITSVGKIEEKGKMGPAQNKSVVILKKLETALGKINSSRSSSSLPLSSLQPLSFFGPRPSLRLPLWPKRCACTAGRATTFDQLNR